MRIGTGFDVHRLVIGRPLILGGVTIPWDKGLLGHSDADVLTHAVMDALLGAAGLGDIGEHFPDSDQRYQGVSSLALLEQVAKMLVHCGWRVENVDAIIVAQAPRITPYKGQMQQNLACSLGIEPFRLNLKATTTEGLGFTGVGEGIAGQAAVLLERL